MCVAVTHRKCDTVLSLKQFAKTMNQNKEPEKVLQVIDDSISEIDNIIKKVGDTRSKLKSQTSDVIQEMSIREAKLQQAIQKLFERLASEVRDIESQEICKLDKQSQACQSLKSELSITRKRLMMSRDHGEDYALIDSVTKWKLFSSLFKERLGELQDDMGDVEVISTLDTSNIDELLGTLQACNIQVKKAKQREPLKDKRAQLVTQFSGRTPTDSKTCLFTDVLVLENQQIVCCDFNNSKIKLFGVDDGRFISEMACKGQPGGVACISPCTIVVSLFNPAQLLFITIQTSELLLQKTVTPSTDGLNYYGVCAVGDQLVVMCGISIMLLSMDGKLLKTIDRDNMGREFLDLYGVSKLSDREMVVTYMHANALSCVGVDGQCRFWYQDDIMEKPLGVAVDRDGNIYVCARESHAIHQVAPDGTLIKILLSDKDGLKSPRSIGFDPQGTDFIVASDNSDIMKVYRMV